MKTPILTYPGYWSRIPASTKSHWHKVSAMTDAWVLTRRVHITGLKPGKGIAGQQVRIASAKNISSKIAVLDPVKLVAIGFVFLRDDSTTMTQSESMDYLTQLKIEKAFK